jgi:hypothetical protein
MRNRILRFSGFFLLACAVSALTACGSAKTRIERVVKQEFQEKMQTAPFDTFDIVVQQVKLVKAGQRRYDGEVIIVVNGTLSSIDIDVRIEGKTVIWEEKNYMDYLPVFGSEIFNALMKLFNGL